MLHRCESGAIFTMTTALLFILFWTSESFISAAHLSTTSTAMPSPSRHVISFLNQKKSKDNLDDNILETAINVTENIDNEFQKNLSYQINIIRSALKRLRLPLEDFDRNVLTRQIHDDADAPATGEEGGINEEEKNSENSHKNMNSHNPHGERPSFANNLWHHARSRLETLEPFHNLLNTIRERIHGNRSVALTPQHRKKSHSMHLLHPHKEVSGGGVGGGGEHHESAIETENERIMINESTGFHVLELIGTIVGLAWGFFTNVQGIFAASSGGSIGASSGGSSNTQNENGVV